MSEDQNRGRRRPYGQRSPEDGESESRQAKIFKPQSRETSVSSELSSNQSGPSTSQGVSLALIQPGPSRDRTAERDPRRRRDAFDLVRTRPNDIANKQGSSGQEIKLQANFFRLVTPTKWRIMQYHVVFEPDVEVTRIRRGILSENAKILGTGYIFDGKILFTTKELPSDKNVLKTISKNGTEYTITIKLVGIVATEDSTFLQVLNLILRRAMRGLNLELVGRNMFDPKAKIQMGEYRMELWPGYETSIRQHEKHILLCAEVTHKVMRTETVYHVIKTCSEGHGNFQETVIANILGLIVLTDYNNKTYRINDIDFNQNPLSTFKMKGKDITFADYYKTKYNIKIRDLKQPLLISKMRDKAQKVNSDDLVILIPELCRVTGLNESMRKNFNLMRAMSEHTRMNPQRRIERLYMFNRRLKQTPDSIKILREWDLKLDDKLTEVRGRIIEPQKIVFKDNQKVITNDRADWTASLRSGRMLTTPREGLSRWAVISPMRNSRELGTLVDTLFRVSNGLGLQIRTPTEIKIPDDRTSSYVRAMEECARMDPMMILCLVPNNNLERYSAIKRKGCVERGIPTQVVTLRVANNRGLMSIATKIGIQLNCKLGFTPWMIELPLFDLMTIGFDIAKCTRNRSMAYGALVASMDLTKNSTYYSSVAECSAFDQFSNNLWIMVAKALRQYRREHGNLPKRILFFRDGVSSGSLRYLMEYEVNDVVQKLNKEYANAQAPPPMFAFIVVTKTSSTRFFKDGRNNPPPGTVVDDVVTLPERYDFYLVSQSVNQGTVSPTNYNVVYSNLGLNPDRVQKLAYKMCHLYYNWSGTTRVPAVCQYAKKLATLVATNLHAIPENSLEKKFYYL